MKQPQSKPRLPQGMTGEEIEFTKAALALYRLASGGHAAAQGLVLAVLRACLPDGCDVRQLGQELVKLADEIEAESARQSRAPLN